MSDNFEFDDNDNDDLLLSAVCIPSNGNTTPIKLLIKSSNEENNALKKRKLDDGNSLSPVFQLHKKINNTPNALRRIFPGPAGILSDENVTVTSSQIEADSQNISSNFSGTQWNDMAEDFKISSSLHLFDKFNIGWIKKEATANQFAIQKAPFLAGILVSLEVPEGQTQKSVNVTLKDMTGTIQGNILHNLYEEYANHLTLGSVLILVQFGVLSCTCDRCDNYHLTITPKSLCAIYNCKAKIVIQKIEPQEILKDFCQKKKELTQSVRSQTLVKQNTSFGSPINYNSRHKLTLSNKSRFQDPVNAIPSYHTPQKGYKEESFCQPDPESNCRVTMGNQLQSPVVNKTSDIAPKKLFIFKKITQKSNSPCDITKVEVTSSDFSRDIEICPDSSSDTNTIMSKTRNSFSASEAKFLEPFSSNAIISNKGITSVSSSNISEINAEENVLLSEVGGICRNALENRSKGSTTNDPNIKNRSCNSIKIAGSRVSVNSVEHEKLLKDVLDNVDLNSLFDEDF